MWFSYIFVLVVASGCLAKDSRPSRRHTHTSHSWKPVSQIPDGQLQAPSAQPLSSIIGGSAAASSTSTVTQISYSQIQVPTVSSSVVPPPVQSLPPSQASPVQAPPSVQNSVPVQSYPPAQSSSPAQAPPSMQASSPSAPAPLSATVVQISDGQPQVPKATPSQSAPSQAFSHTASVTSAPPQVPTQAPAPGPSGGGSIVTQISDGQPQAPSAPTIVVSAPSSSLTRSGTAHPAPSSTFATAAGLQLHPGYGLSQYALAVGMVFLAWAV